MAAATDREAPSMAAIAATTAMAAIAATDREAPSMRLGPRQLEEMAPMALENRETPSVRPGH